MIEFELKFQVDPGQRAAVEAAVARGHSQRQRLRARYFDTAEGALAAAHVVLRLRKEGPRWVQTAKASGSSPLERLEHNVELGPVRGAEVPRPEISRHDSTPVGERIAAALKAAGLDTAAAELVPLYATEVWRTTREMRSGDAQVELAYDSGSVRAGERSHPLCELEFELKRGSAAAMLELARRWCGRYALWLDTVSKSERGQRLARGEQHGAPVKALPPEFVAHADGAQIFRAVLHACLLQMLPNASEIAAGSRDAEHLHQLRVGIRRLRTTLREMAGLGPAIDPGWEPALIEAFRALGRQRDREQLQQTLMPQIEAAGGPAFQLQDADGEADPSLVVRAPAFQRVLIELIGASLPPAPGLPAEPGDDAQAAEVVAAVAPKPAAAARKLLRARLSKLHRQVLRDGARFESLDAAGQHRVRKRLKRLRYLGEFVAPLFGRKAAKRFLSALEPAQDALGAHNDHAVAMAASRERASEDGRAWFAVGWLGARQPASAAACREALRKMAAAEPFWN